MGSQSREDLQSLLSRLVAPITIPAKGGDVLSLNLQQKRLASHRRSIRCERDDAGDLVSKLAHIARPVIRTEHRLDALLDRESLLCSRGRLGPEVTEQRPDVFFAFAKRSTCD